MLARLFGREHVTAWGRFSPVGHAKIQMEKWNTHRAAALWACSPGERSFPMSQPSVPLRDPLKAAFLAWLIPGWGHLYQGRKGKAILYATCILGLYLMGMLMGDGKIVYWRWVSPFEKPEKFCIYYLGQFWVGLAALPALIQGTLQHYGHDPILGGFLAEPPQAILNGLHPRLGKLVEIGTIYTTIAGLLNILAIYDAYEGPAYVEYEEATASTTFTTGALGGGELKAEGSPS
jgi:hypothetical protein